MARIYRIADDGELFEPHRYADGCFRVGDPTLGSRKHHVENQIAVVTEDELVSYIRRGFAVRMRGSSGKPPGLISAAQIVVEDDHTSAPIAAAVPPVCPPAATAPAVAPAVSRTAASPDDGTGLLPAHGRIACGRCFPGGEAVWGVSKTEGHGWRLENNPMAWGGRDPRVLVLGFSKGPNQSDDLFTRRHEDIAFARGRRALGAILETMGVLPRGKTVDQLIADPAGDIAFGSLVRCSVSKADGAGGWLKTGKDIMTSCLRDPRSATVVSNCAERFLAKLPPRLELVVMLGNDLRYVDGCRQAIAAVRPGIRPVNEVAYTDGKVLFVHTIHFAAQGALVPDWCTGVPGRASKPESDQPRKRELALAALRHVGLHATA